MTLVALTFTYRVIGTGFNGLSQAVSYGDDASMATNYPIACFVNLASAHIRYGRTSDHSTMVAPRTRLKSKPL